MYSVFLCLVETVLQGKKNIYIRLFLILAVILWKDRIKSLPTKHLLQETEHFLKLVFLLGLTSNPKIEEEAETGRGVEIKTCRRV